MRAGKEVGESSVGGKLCFLALKHHEAIYLELAGVSLTREDDGTTPAQWKNVAAKLIGELTCEKTSKKRKRDDGEDNAAAELLISNAY